MGALPKQHFRENLLNTRAFLSQKQVNREVTRLKFIKAHIDIFLGNELQIKHVKSHHLNKKKLKGLCSSMSEVFLME